jgi:hypothetical protein
MARMQAEADSLDADGVVGVRLEWHQHIGLPKPSRRNSCLPCTTDGGFRCREGKPNRQPSLETAGAG